MTRQTSRFSLADLPTAELLEMEVAWLEWCKAASYVPGRFVKKAWVAGWLKSKGYQKSCDSLS